MSAEQKSRAFALARAGRFAEALPLYEQLCALSPGDAEAWYLQGAVLEQLRHRDEAIAAMRKAVALRPQQVDWLNHLGTLLELKEDFAGAEVCYRGVLAANPNHPPGRYNLGNVLNKRLQYAEALEHLRIALRFFPNEPRVHYGIGLSLHGTREFKEAIPALRKAIALDPRYADAHNALGMALRDTDDRSGAIASFRNALSADPNHPYANNNLGGMLMEEGRAAEGREHYRRAMAAKPEWFVPNSNLVFSMNYDVTDGQAMLDAHRAWNVAHASRLPPPSPFPNTRDPERRLRIGYVSPDFRTHSVMFFLRGLLERHNRQAFEIFCYADVARPDATTEAVRGMEVTWRDIHRIEDEKVAEIIRSDQIDILVDLAGHTSDHRLMVFARRPAPMQVTWLGYPNTTGLAAMDYRITDAWADPPGMTEAWHTEELIRLPHGFSCYTPPADAPPVVPPPCEARGSVTFGSFNNLSKLSTSAIEAWSRILRVVPGSRLLLKSGPLLDKTVCEQTVARFVAYGVEPQRIVPLPQAASMVDHLRLYGELDIALDTFPYHGTTTTCEALWMGVPVITLAGNLHVSRVGVSLLNQIGLHGCITDDTDGYVRAAVALAGNVQHLAQLRQELRGRMQASSLCDAAGFAREIESAYCDMWRRWCNR